MKISTSILSAKNRNDSTLKLNTTNTDYIHIDVMDGEFVPNKQFPLEEIEHIINISTKPVDIHLMVNNPKYYIENLKSKKIAFITIHIEIKDNIKEIINLIHLKGYKVGLAIKPKTNINEIIPYLDIIDMILVMSVEPGFGGQKFIEETPQKIIELKKHNNKIIYEIDGGINNETIEKIRIIVDIVVIGSFIINSSNYQKTINNLKN